MSWIYKQAYPDIAKANRVRQFVLGEYYFCLGKSSPWGVPDFPPDVPLGIKLVPEPIVYIRPKYVLPALRSPCGNKVMCGPQGVVETWNVFYEPLEEHHQPTHVYVSAEIKDEYWLTDTFRCTALISNLKLINNAFNALTYSPTFIEGQGVLEWVCFHSPVEKVFSRRARLIEFMLEP